MKENRLLTERKRLIERCTSAYILHIQPSKRMFGNIFYKIASYGTLIKFNLIFQ